MKITMFDGVRLRMWDILGSARWYTIGWVEMRVDARRDRTASARRQENGLQCALILGGAK